MPHPFDGNFAQFCAAPSITTFCSGQQFFSATDGHGVPLDWTFTDQNNTCVKVTFALHGAPQSGMLRSVDLYIPNADASAIFNYTWVDGSGSHTQSFNENPVDGWQPFIASSSTASSLAFTDHDSPGAIKLGWGSTFGHGMREFCS